MKTIDFKVELVLSCPKSKTLKYAISNQIQAIEDLLKSESKIGLDRWQVLFDIQSILRAIEMEINNGRITYLD